MRLLKLLINFFLSSKNKARREAQTDFEALMNQIKFAGTMPRIYVLQDDVLDYHNTWSAIIDYETLTLFVGALYKALSERESMVQAERNRCYKGKSIYN
jgi:hypothetical protein